MSTKGGKIGVRDLHRAYAAGEKIVALTAYDALFGRLADESGVDLILVGDSLGMTVLGFRNTIPVTIEQMLHHTAAVCRAVTRAMVIADLPFMTYQVSAEQALTNAGRCLKESGADGVKLEGGRTVSPTIARLVQSGIPVLGHIGLLPQSVLADGGYRVHGRERGEAEGLKRDAEAVQAAGAFAVVLEGLPAALSAEITASLEIPTIGIGAGPDCSGQVQVVHDILGLFEEFLPRHAKRYAELADVMRRAMRTYSDEVRRGAFPDEEHSF